MLADEYILIFLFTISSGSSFRKINSWSYKLFRQNRKTDAVEIFKLNVALYPNSSNVFDSLGESYAEIGETALAIKNYEMALQLDPKSTNAVEQLKKLRAAQ